MERWWIDTFTVDPSQLLHDMRGLWQYAMPHTVMATAMENANVGTLRGTVCGGASRHHMRRRFAGLSSATY